MSDFWISFWIFAGSFGLTLFGLGVRYVLASLDVASLADWLLALIAYQISLVTSDEALRIMVPVPDDRVLFADWGFVPVAVSVVAYVFAIRPGELLWTHRHIAHGRGDMEAYWHDVRWGFVLGWLLPVALVAWHVLLWLGV